MSSDVETRQHCKSEEHESISVRHSDTVMNSNDPSRARGFCAKILGGLPDTPWGEHRGESDSCNDVDRGVFVAPLVRVRR